MQRYDHFEDRVLWVGSNYGDITHWAYFPGIPIPRKG
jgi:hypothetical protein